MRVLFLTDNCDGIPCAIKTAREGHTVKVFARGNKYGLGVVDHINSWREELKTSDLLVCASPYFVSKENILRHNAKSFIGASHDLTTVMSLKLTDFLAMSGIVYEEISSRDCAYMLHGFFNGRDWVKPFMISVHDSHLFPYKVGPIVGSMGCVMRRLDIIPDYVLRIGETLRKASIRDMVTIVLNKDSQIINIVPGLLTEVLDCMIEGLKCNISDVLFDCSTGVLVELDITQDYIVYVKLSAPPFPYNGNGFDKFIVAGLDEKNLKHVHLYEVNLVGDDYICSPNTGVVLAVTARGQDIAEARRRAYRTISNINFPAKQYRYDIGKELENNSDLRKLFNG